MLDASATVSPDDTVAHTLARWEADEARVRARLAAPGVAPIEALRARSGLEVLAAIGAGELPSVPIADALDFCPIEYEAGRMVFQGRPSRKFMNPLGTIHGGWIATLLDSAVACAVHTMLPAGKQYTTAELKISFVRGLTPETKLVRAEGRIIHAGRQAGFADGRLYGPDGRLYAHASTTCIVLQ